MSSLLECECGQRYAGPAVGPDGKPECPLCREVREQGSALESVAPDRAVRAAARERGANSEFHQDGGSPRYSFRQNPIRFLLSASIAVVCFLVILFVFLNLAMRVAVRGVDGFCLFGVVVMFVLYFIARGLMRPFARQKGDPA